MGLHRRASLCLISLLALLWLGWRVFRGSKKTISNAQAKSIAVLDGILGEVHDDAAQIARQALSRAGFAGHARPVLGFRNGANLVSIDRAQDLLDCVSMHGEWVSAELDKGMQASRITHQMDPVYGKCDKRRIKDKAMPDSSRMSWRPSAGCIAKVLDVSRTMDSQEEWLPRILPKVTRRRFCDTMRHNAVYIVGDSIQFALHELLLDLGTREKQMCYGELYCGTHWFCGSEDFAHEDDREWISPHGPVVLSTDADLNSSRAVVRHEKRRTKNGETLEEYARLRFRRSDNLWPLTSTHETGRILGLREKEERNRLKGGPVHDSTFRQHPLLHSAKLDLWLPDMGRSRLAVIGRGAVLDPDYDESRFSQELVEALAKSSRYSLANPEGETLIVWRGNYLPHTDCYNSTKGQLRGSKELDGDDFEKRKLLRNLTRQNVMAREIIRAFGGLYWDTATALQSRHDGHIGPLAGGATQNPVDCWRYCIPGPTDYWLDILFWIMYWANGQSNGRAKTLTG